MSVSIADTDHGPELTTPTVSADGGVVHHPSVSATLHEAIPAFEVASGPDPGRAVDLRGPAAVVNQAVGVVMVRLGVGAVLAFDLLLGQASHDSLGLLEAARALLGTV